MSKTNNIRSKTNLNKIDKATTNEIIEQKTEFETNKRQKQLRKSPFIINENETNDTEDKPNNNDEENPNNVIISSPEDELKILELSGVTNNNKEEEEKKEKENSGSKNLISNNPMLREIELFVQKNMDEMYQALEELKASFQDEIKEAEENGFDDIRIKRRFTK